MDLRIWKYLLDVTDEQIVSMPEGARILSVRSQRDILTLWALVDPDAKREHVTVYVVGTGDPAVHVDDADFVGTVQDFGGTMIWHVFARRARAEGGE